MKAGWMKGALTGAMMGASAMAVFAVMNRGASKRMIDTMSTAAHKTADKAQKLMNQML